MTEIRPPAVAGMFYPASARALAAAVDTLLAQESVDHDERLAVAYAVPHAGYRYSGPVAATVYARIGVHARQIARVVLIGPAHRVPLVGCALSGAAAWSTPLGEVPVDTDLLRRVPEALARVDDDAHAQEHSLEVQLPFLQRVLPAGTPVLPVCVGRSEPEAVAALLSAVGVGDPGTLLVCSTDLSHYLPDRVAREQDRRTADAVMELSPERVGLRDACGVYALRGLLRWAGADGGIVPRTLALATSAETGGDPGRVVGYPAFAFGRGRG